MTTEREYQEWQRQKKKHIKRRRSKSNINAIFWLIIIFISVAITVKNNPDLFSFPRNKDNSLKSLTEEFITEINELIIYSSANNLQNLNFYTIDQQAKKIKYDGDSIAELGDILSSYANTEVEKARIIYSWITYNISYDVPALSELLNRNIYPDVTTKAVLRNKATICSGYANLYHQLAEKMGLKSVIVLGYAKGGDYIVGQDKRVNHAWNSVQINQNWYLIDPTWGAGTVNNNLFVPKFNPFYFATQPQQFIYTHFPEDNQLQLLNPTYTRSQFDNLPNVSPNLFTNDIQLISHKSENISVNNSLSLTLQAPKNIVAIAQLKSQEKLLQGNYILVQRQGNNIIVNVKFPHKGDYQLDIFAKQKDNNNYYPLIVSYDVSASSSSQEFPMTFTNFYQNNGYLESPLEANLINNQNHYFKIRIDDATDIQVVNKSTNKSYKLTRYGNVFTGNINIDSGKVVIFAKFPNDSRYWALLEYD